MPNQKTMTDVKPSERISLSIPVEVNNMETLLTALENQQEMPCHNSFLDLHEEPFVDEDDYQRMSFNEYDYTVKINNDSLE